MNDLYRNSMFGALIADAVSMPVHWYYDTRALDEDYGELDGYVAPKNPHSGSILWRSHYKPRNARGDILHEQASYWGQRGVHYHQFLKAGANTINYKLGTELYLQIAQSGAYDPDAWLAHYIKCMLQKGWHQDTYVEEYHRAFFDNYAGDKAPRDCGIDDIHIGGISQVPSLLGALNKVGVTDLDAQLATVKTHVELTHRNHHVVEAAQSLTRTLQALSDGQELRTAIEAHASAWTKPGQFDTWSIFPDRTVVGRHLSPACYLPESYTASLYLAWKYAGDFAGGILANAHCGGDNCHRGAVVGALLGASCEIESKWVEGLAATSKLDCEDSKS
jgi:ADP-ribosylglycohydrolase